MMRRGPVLGLIAMTLAFPCGASAQPPTLTPWIGIHAAWATYDMSDVNTDIGAINAALAGTGLSMDEIRSGFTLGGRAGLTTPGGFTFGLGYERLMATSDVGDPTGSITYRLPANAIFGTVGYRFASPPGGSLAARIGADIGRISEAGEIEISVVGSGAETVGIDGAGPLIEPWLGGELTMTPNLSFSGSLGYRFAKISEVEALGQTIYNADGSKYSVDYSGLVMRLGITLSAAR